MESAASGINANHRRAILAAFRHIDGLLTEIDSASAGAKSPFTSLFPDLSPVEQQVIEDYLAEIRTRMTKVLEALDVKIRPPENPASWGIQTHLSFAQITVQEIDPRRLSGFGPLSAEAAALILRANADLERILRRLQTYVAQGLGKDLAERLARLDQAPLDIGLLRILEGAIRRHGLIEYHAALEALLERLEAKTLEIAVFGRVSSGKSSLLNAVLGSDALPVGITPITAVPTRVTWGERPQAEIRFASGPDLTVSLPELPDFVSETGNPENRKRITRAVVRLPSRELRDGVVFVDTPGVGSLASSGARESYAYLPRCDLGILLIDAASTPTREDLELLRMLYESAIPGMVVLSKADLVPPADRERLQKYVSEQLAAHLGLDLPVHLVSAAGNGELARSWFADEIAPLLVKASDLAAASARRKLASLREGVAASLSTMLGEKEEADERAEDRVDEVVERWALEAEGVVGDAARRADRAAEQARSLWEPTFDVAAREVVRQVQTRGALPAGEILGQAMVDTSAALRRQIQEAFASARDRLLEILQRMAQSVQSGPVSPDAVVVDFVALPALSLPGEVEKLDLPISGWMGRMPELLERRIAARLRKRLGATVRAAYESLASELRRWIFAAEKDLGNRFGVSAEPLRARARRRTTGTGRSDPEKIAADLAQIQAAASDVKPAGT